MADHDRQSAVSGCLMLQTSDTRLWGNFCIFRQEAFVTQFHTVHVTCLHVSCAWVCRFCISFTAQKKKIHTHTHARLTFSAHGVKKSTHSKTAGSWQNFIFIFNAHVEIIVLISKTGQLQSMCFLGNTFILNWHIKHICLSTDRCSVYGLWLSRLI